MNLIKSSSEKAMSTGNLAPAICLIVASIVILFVLTLKSPGSGDPVAIVFDTSVSAEEAFLRVAALDGRILREGGWDNVIVAAFAPGTSFQALKEMGALFTLDPILTGGCSQSNYRPQKGQTA